MLLIVKGGTEEGFLKLRKELSRAQLAKWRETCQKYLLKDLTRHQLESRKMGAGRKEKAIPKGGTIHKSLLEFMETMRGMRGDDNVLSQPPLINV
jgi:hypothetical protein